MGKMQYGTLAKQLNLTPEQTDKFYQILIDSSLNAAEKGLSMMSGENSTNGTPSAADQKKQTDADLQALLGDDGFSQYTAYQKTLADRMQLNQIKNDFTDSPLSDDQQKRLLQVMITARQNTAGDMPDTSQMSTPDRIAMGSQMLQQQGTNQRAGAPASGAVLSSDQIQTPWQFSESNFLNMQKVGIEMAPKMLGTNSPAGQ